MKWKLLMPVLAITLASPAHAEKLTFDYRIYPPLEEVLNSGRKAMLHYDDSNPKYVINRIAVQGASVENWTEALDIVARLKGAKMKSAADWAREIRQRSLALCPRAEFTTVAEDAKSLTFVRRSTGCPAGTAQTGLYRIVAGRRSLFLLNAFSLDEMADTSRQKWLELFSSAHLEP